MMAAPRRRLALWAFAPVAAVLPVSLLALTLVWWPLSVWWDVPWWMFVAGYAAAGVVLFLRPVQAIVLTAVLGTRRPTRDERARLDTAWRGVLQAADVPGRRYLLNVLPSDELNAFACGGHLVVVTSFAVESLPRDELAGVLAHELCHHLGAHTVAGTIGQWLSLPAELMARIGFSLQNVAEAAGATLARGRIGIQALTTLLSTLLTWLSWVFLSGLIASNWLANRVAANSEFDADDRAAELGFGRPLASALRRAAANELGDQRFDGGWRGALARTHPPARTRVARLEAKLRHASAGRR